MQELKLVDRTDPAMQLIAKRIMDLAQQGERDPIRLRGGECQARLGVSVPARRGRESSGCQHLHGLGRPGNPNALADQELYPACCFANVAFLSHCET